MNLPNDINPGIRATVEWLQSKHYETTDSGDGETHLYECDQDRPYVHIQVYPWEMVKLAKRLATQLSDIGIKTKPMDETNSVPNIQCSYCPAERIGIITLWNVKL